MGPGEWIRSLAPIRTAVTLLRLKELPDAQRVRARDIIERQVEHLVCLITTSAVTNA